MSKLRDNIYRGLISCRIVEPEVIVLLDGGICSQMHQYLLGQFYVERGYSVSYDLTFYDEWGTDLNSQFIRCFDLLKAFPYLELRTASKMAIKVYKRKFYITGNDTNERTNDLSFLERTPPIYLGGYYRLPSELWLSLFRNLFKLSPDVLDVSNKELWHEIVNRKSAVAVHVRRGDLKVEVYSYGKPASLTYFRTAISFMQKKESEPYFYFFSDEPAWVIDELLPSLSLLGNARIVDVNDSGKGYMDLYLIACCKHQITSKGTLGKHGALLNDCPEKYVTLCDDETQHFWGDLFYNPVFL